MAEASTRSIKSLRKAMAAGAGPGEFSDRELAFLTTSYARSIYVTIITIVLVGVGGSLLLWLAFAIDSTSS